MLVKVKTNDESSSKHHYSETLIQQQVNGHPTHRFTKRVEILVVVIHKVF